MAENSKIEWTDHTFSPWTGCTKVSPGCDHCYAEGWSKRSGHVQWGPHGERRRTSAANWRNPLKWNAEAARTGIRRKVFCASLADVFDNHKSILPSWRADLWALIAATPHLDWLLLTKRPQNIDKMLPHAWNGGWPNVWLGTTVENQTEADRRIPHLLSVRAAVRFLSVEPMLGPVRLDQVAAPHDMAEGQPWLNALSGFVWDTDGDTCPIGERLDWIICGGESGPGARVWVGFEDAARSLRDQCAAAGVDFFMKQMAGPRKATMPPIPNDLMVRQMPRRDGRIGGERMDHREQNSTCPVTWDEEPRGFLSEWQATPLEPTEDAKMQRYNPTIGNQDYVGEAWATMQADALGEYVCHDEAAAIIRTQAARIAELEGEREALSLAICGGEDAPGYAASLNVAVLEEVARSNRLSHIQALETVSRNLRHWREECGKLYSRIATLEAEKRESVMQQLASDGQACEAYAAQRVAEAEVARLREALGDALDAWDTHNETGDMMDGYWVSDTRAALAQKEAGE